MLEKKVAYLKGLCEGMKIDETTNEGKLLLNIIDVLEDFASEIMAINDTDDELQEQINEIDNDLAFVEDYLFEDDEYDDIDFGVEDIDCPYCGESIAFDTDLLIDEKDVVTCPACGKEFELEFEDFCGCKDDCDDDFDCGCQNMEED